jgi:prepilin-type N-terminal cleavage/methylation domain-containing protein
LRLGAGNGARKRRAGFTLVEVIVVLVILAILAAIAIPALTGYIDKARDKEWIMKARDAHVAMRAVLTELYTDGEGILNIGLTGNYANYLTDGDQTYAVSSTADFKYFNIGMLSRNNHPQLANDDTAPDGASYVVYSDMANELMGIAPVGSSEVAGYWEMYLLAKKGSSDNIFSAPAFIYAYYPDATGRASGNEVVVVSYGVGNLTEKNTDSWGNFFNGIASKNHSTSDYSIYDLNAGYHVFYFDSPE